MRPNLTGVRQKGALNQRPTCFLMSLNADSHWNSSGSTRVEAASTRDKDDVHSTNFSHAWGRHKYQGGPKVIRWLKFVSLRALLLVIASAALVMPRHSFGKDLETRHLFVIERSKNANVVQYDVQLTADGKLHPREPVIAYWIRYAKDGQKKGLSFAQRRWAYGFKTKYNAKTNSATMEMVAKIDRKIKVHEIDGVYHGQTRIDGRPAFIDKIFITSTEEGTLPKVESIELYGKDRETGVDRYEKIKP